MAQGYDGFEGLKNRKFIVDDENGQIMSSIIRSFLLGEFAESGVKLSAAVNQRCSPLKSHTACMSLPANHPGSAYIFRHKQLMEAHDTHLSSRTDKVISRARQIHHSPTSSLSSSPTSTRGGGGGGGSGAMWGGRTQSHPGPGPNANWSPLSTHAELPLQDSVASLPPRPVDGWGSIRRHVVKHDRRSIRDALWVGRNEHMSGVDDCVSQHLAFSGRRLVVGLRGRRCAVSDGVRRAAIDRALDTLDMLQTPQVVSTSRSTSSP